jgi:hypothetical protein
VPFSKFLMECCAFLKDPGVVLCISGISSWDFAHFWKFLVGFCAFLEVPHVILCSFGSSSWDCLQFWKFLVGLCIFESSSWDCVHFGSSSWDFVHYSKSIMIFCASLEVPHGILYIFRISSWQTIHVSIWSFHFFSTKYEFLQHAYWLIAAIATSSKRHPVITNIRVTRPRLMRRRRIVTFVWRRCPSLGLSQILFIYDFSHIFFLAISTASKLWLGWTIDDSTILRTLWFFFNHS